MTSLDASNKLFEWFAENDTFSLERDFDGVMPEFNDGGEGCAILTCALKDLETIDFIQNCDDFWVLKKPFVSFSQNVELQPQVCLGISQIINGFCDVIGDETDSCDPSRVQPKDITNMLTICGYLMQQNSQESDKEESNKEE